MTCGVFDVSALACVLKTRRRIPRVAENDDFRLEMHMTEPAAKRTKARHITTSHVSPIR